VRQSWRRAGTQLNQLIELKKLIAVCRNLDMAIGEFWTRFVHSFPRLAATRDGQSRQRNQLALARGKPLLET
jgi:hypothetical protein